MGKKPVIVAITGASGAPYAIRLVESLLAAGEAVDLLISTAGRLLLREECDFIVDADEGLARQTLQERFGQAAPEQLRYYGIDNWYSPLASGSGGRRQMVVCPCSMGTLAAIAHGLSDNLIERAADVVLKEGGELTLVPRETPLSAIHLENMLKLARLGVAIIPAAPGFYQRPQSVDDMVNFMVMRIMEKLDSPMVGVKPWGE